MAKEVVMVPREKYTKLMEIYEKKVQNQSEEDHIQSKGTINLNITDKKDETPIEANNTTIEEENSLKDNDLNLLSNTTESKETRSNPDVISPSSDTKDDVILVSNQTQLNNSPDVSPDFAVYKSISKITKARKRSEKRRKITRKTWLKL